MSSSFFKTVACIAYVLPVSLPGLTIQNTGFRKIVILNRTSFYMTSLSMSASGSHEPKKEAFTRGEILPPGMAFVIGIRGNAPCAIDFKAHFRNGNDMYDKYVDTCTVQYLDYSDYT